MSFSADDTLDQSRLLESLRAHGISISSFDSPNASSNEQNVHFMDQWSEDIINKFSNSKHNWIIENGVLEQEELLSLELHNPKSLTLILSSKTTYEEDVTNALLNYLQAQSFSQDFMDIFVTVCQELITNAVLHGNLAVHFKLEDEFAERSLQILEIFDEIREKLHETDLGQKPIIIRLKCFKNYVDLEIQDFGQGFDFDAFQKKYEDSKLQKGMDLIFLLSREMRYEQNTKTMCVSLDDPEKKIPDQSEVDPFDLQIGIVSVSRPHFRILKEVMLDRGFKDVVQLSENSVHDANTLGNLDLIIHLSHPDLEQIKQNLLQIREHKTRFELPILLQKLPNMDTEFFQKSSNLVNDYISDIGNITEAINRIKTHCEIGAARKALTFFYEDYQKEILQSQKTLNAFENNEILTIADHSTQQKYQALIRSSQTTLDSLYDDALTPEDKKSPYSQGLTFQIANQQYFIFVSFERRFSSILIYSYLKGFVESFKEKNEIMHPEKIVENSCAYLKKIAPPDYKIKIICCMWQAEKGQFLFAHRGNFLPLEYMHKENKTQVFKDHASGIFKLDHNRLFFIFDIETQINFTEITEFCQEFLSSDIAKIDSAELPQHLYQIPHLFIFPILNHES